MGREIHHQKRWIKDKYKIITTVDFDSGSYEVQLQLIEDIDAPHITQTNEQKIGEYSYTETHLDNVESRVQVMVRRAISDIDELEEAKKKTIDITTEKYNEY